MKPFASALTAVLIALAPARAADPAPRYDLRLQASAVQSAPQHYSNVTPPMISAEGVVMYGVRGTGRIVLRRLEDLKVLRTVDTAFQYMNYVEWLEDGRVFGCGSESKIWSADFGRVEAAWPGNAFIAVHEDFHRAGDVLAQFVSGSSMNRKIIPPWIRLFSLRGEVVNVRSKFDQESQRGDLSTDRVSLTGGLAPGGRHAVVLFDGDRREVGIWKYFSRLVVYESPGLRPVAIHDFKPKEQAPFHARFVFAPDGGRFAVQMRDPDAIVVYDVPSLARAATLPYKDGNHPLNFSPDGRLLAICGEDGKAARRLRILDASDWSVVASTPTASCGHTRFSPDGRRLVAVEGLPWDGKSRTLYERINVWELREPPGRDAAPRDAAPDFGGAVPLLR